MRIIFYVLGLLVVLFGLSFSMLNPGKVVIHYFFISKALPLSLLLGITLGLGLLLGILGMAIPYLKIKKENFVLKHKLKAVKPL